MLLYLSSSVSSSISSLNSKKSGRKERRSPPLRKKEILLPPYHASWTKDYLHYDLILKNVNIIVETLGDINFSLNIVVYSHQECRKKKLQNYKR